MRAMRTNRGFTLIELSIVLVVIGLIIGGIFVGKDMIRSSELNNLTSQMQQVQAAVLTFRDKYSSLPGDSANAYLFFGNACDPTPSNCNGNGNGKIENTGPSWAYQESFRFFQHLSLAGLIPGSYTGIFNNAVTPGVNVPALKISSAASIWPYYWDKQSYFRVNYDSADPADRAGERANILAVGYTFMPLRTDEAMRIDLKVDDGKPGTGDLIGAPYTNGCSTTNNPATAEYKLTMTDMACDFGKIL